MNQFFQLAEYITLATESIFDVKFVKIRNIQIQKRISAEEGREDVQKQWQIEDGKGIVCVINDGKEAKCALSSRSLICVDIYIYLS